MGRLRGSRQGFPSPSGRPVARNLDSIVVVELALRPPRHQAKDAHMKVAHDGGPAHSGTGIDTATACGSE
jgi:hypothetical protein